MLLSRARCSPTPLRACSAGCGLAEPADLEEDGARRSAVRQPNSRRALKTAAARTAWARRWRLDNSCTHRYRPPAGSSSDVGLSRCAQRRHERVSRSMTWRSSIALELGLIEGAPAYIFVVGTAAWWPMHRGTVKSSRIWRSNPERRSADLAGRSRRSPQPATTPLADPMDTVGRPRPDRIRPLRLSGAAATSPLGVRSERCQPRSHGRGVLALRRCG